MIKKIYSKVRGDGQNKVVFPENKELRSRFEGRDKGYILGSSASILKFDLTKLEDDALKISVGNFYEHPDIEPIQPTIQVFAASHDPITNTVLTNWWRRCNEVLPSGIPVLVANRDREVAEACFQGRDVYFYKYGGQLPIDFTKRVLSPWSVSVLVV